MKFQTQILLFYFFSKICTVICSHLNRISNSITFSEDGYNQKYLVKIPPQKETIRVDDIEVFIFTDYFVIWVRGSGNEINKKFYDESQHVFSQIRSLNVGRDYEIWENFIQPIKNGTIPNISKKKWLDNSFTITLSFPLAAVDKDRFIPLHKLYSFNDSLTLAKVDYRMKLPKNPHFVRRTIHKNDGKSVDIFTVAEENSISINEMEQTIKTNNSELMQNNTVSFLNDEINSRDNNYTLFNIGN